MNRPVCDNNVEEDDGNPLPKYSISTQPADYPLGVLRKKYKNGEIVIPRFRREFVWTIPQASKLVESFIMGLPVPPLYLYGVVDDDKLQVADGVQRLLVISAFIDGQVPGGNHEFRLRGMHERSELYGKTFADFAPNVQAKFKNSILRCVIIRQWDAADGGDSVYQVFSRLNTGSMALNPQEIRNCIYDGPFLDMIKYLNTDEKWRKICGKPFPDKRKKDEELILRYMALFHGGNDYKKPMTGFLNNFVQKHRHANESFLNAEKIRFQNTCDEILQCLGENPLCYEQGFHTALFDSVFVAFAKNPDMSTHDITKKMTKLRDNRQFQGDIEQGTFDEKNVKSRLALAESILFG